MTAPPQSEVLVDLALSRWTLGQSEEGEPFAVADDMPTVARTLRGRGSFRAELAAAHRRLEGKPPSSSALTDALAVLEGNARAEDRRRLHVRVARAGPARVVIDLGDEHGRAVVITPNGWEQCDRPGVLFRRTEATGQLPVPEPGGDLGQLRELLNVTDEDWPLVVGWLVAVLIEDIPHPLLALLGEQGTGKSTAERLIARTVDPSPAQLRTAPRDVEQWVIAAGASWIVALDNMSSISPTLSDALCRAATGDGLVRRRLYTDSDVSVVALRRAVMLSAIDTGSLRGDLADRLLAIELTRIGTRQRQQEAIIETRFDDAHPLILGALLILLAEVLERLPRLHLPELPRMADFAMVLAAVDDVLGTNSLQAYVSQSGRLAEVVVESDPVAEALLQLVADHGPVAATAAELLERLTPDRVPKGWPATPRAMAERIKRAAPALRDLGLEVEHRRVHGGRRVWEMAVSDSSPSRPSPPSPPSPRPPAGPSSPPSPDQPQFVTAAVHGQPRAAGVLDPVGDGGDGGDAHRPYVSPELAGTNGSPIHQDNRSS